MQNLTDEHFKINLSEKIDTNLKDIYNKIKGKKVFIFDLETTGLFDRKDFYKYWDNKVFDPARIIEIGYYYSNNFDSDNIFADPIEDILGCVEVDKNELSSIEPPSKIKKISLNDFTKNNIIHTYLRKPTDFNSIDPVAESKHGISINKLLSDGYKFSQILNTDLLRKLNNAEYIISHNTMFDFYILLNELNRFKLKNTIKHLLEIKTDKKLLCTCRASGYLTLEKLYTSIFNCVPEVFHRAGDDVKTLVEIIARKQLVLVYKTELD